MDIQEETEVNDSDEHLQDQNEITNEQVSAKSKFRMRYLFYIHLVIFILGGLLGGLAIYLIENSSQVKTREMEVSYINAWFVSSTCICGCGLTTVSFAKLTKTSQIVLLVLTVLFGFTMSTLPALAIKAYSHKNARRTSIDNDHTEEVHQSSSSWLSSTCLPLELEEKFALLPTPRQIRYWAYMTISIFILVIVIAVYFFYFIIIGAWLDHRYTENELKEGNVTINPWYASIVIVITGFNQNGLSPFSDGMDRFVNDVYMNIFVMMVILSGVSLFPFLLRNAIRLGRRLAPCRYKIVFDYILLNHHHLSTLLYPALQTRIYLFATFLLYLMAISISLVIDMDNSYLSQSSTGTRVLIFVFHAVNARFAGFHTIDISRLTFATLIIYLLLMSTKPQMLCNLDKSRFELIWTSLAEDQQQDSPITDSVDNTQILHRRAPSTVSGEALVKRRFKHYLHRQQMSVKEQLRHIQTVGDAEQKHRRISRLYCRFFLLKCIHTLFKHTMYTLSHTHTWLFIFIFLICAIEHERMVADSEITVFKVVFEIISAFGCVGFSLGYPAISSSFATILSPTSRLIVGCTMVLGRHRGLLASMKDQEKIEHTANELLQKWKERAIQQYLSTARNKVIMTRF